MTYPLIGNYGVPSTELQDEGLTPSLPMYFESNKIQISGLIVSNYVEEHYSHWAATQSLGSWLKSQGIPAIFGVDTRQITKVIREHGSLLAQMACACDSSEEAKFSDPNARHLVAEVSTKEVTSYKPTDCEPKTKILAFDCGIKYNIIRYLVKVHKVELVVMPYNYALAEKLASHEDWEGKGWTGLFYLMDLEILLCARI